MDTGFCVEALQKALNRYGSPEIFNTDSENDGVGSLSTIPSYPTTNCLRIASTARYTGRPDPNTDRLSFVSFPGSVGRLSHHAVRFSYTIAVKARRSAPETSIMLCLRIRKTRMRSIRRNPESDANLRYIHQLGQSFTRFSVEEAASDCEKDRICGRTDFQRTFSGSRRLGYTGVYRPLCAASHKV